MAEHLTLPVREFDDRMYHASRAAYWLQHHSVLGFTTHNPRQVSFPIGGELWFFWPLLFTRGEGAAQLVFGLGFPLCAAGVYWTLREAGASRSAAVLGTATFCFAPMVLFHTRGLRGELWAALYAVGCAFWTLRAARDEAGRTLPYVMAGLCFGLAVGVKVTVLPLALGLAVLGLIVAKRKAAASGAVLAGVVVGLIFGGFVAIVAYNWKTFGHPLGSRDFREVHSADISRTQVRAHAARTMMSFLDPPMTPSPAARDSLTRAGERFASALGADVVLPMEDRPWPGRYAYQVGPFAGGYSIAGVAWITLLIVALVGIAWDVARSWPRVRLSTTSLLVLFAAPALLAPAFAIRWTAGVNRFWLPAYALGVIVFVPMLERYASRRRWVTITCVIALVAMAAPAAYEHFARSRELLTTEWSPVGLDEPFFEPVARIGDDAATILLMSGTDDVRDYPLFAPRRGFVNRVVSWGLGPFDEPRLRQLLTERGVTHVLIYPDAGPTTEPFVKWLTLQPDWQDVPLPYTPGMRLFARQTRPNGPPASLPIR